MKETVQIDHLQFGYKKGKPLFQELNLTLQGGQIYGLLGRNGAGKTTLLKLIAGLLEPWSGSIQTLGHSSFKRDTAMLEDICFIPEEWSVPDMDIRTLVTVYAPFYPLFDTDLFWRLIEEFDLPSEGKITSSSFGQKKKVIISFGLATRSRLLILDEPTNGLDIPSKSKFRKIISSSIHDDTCILISTHQVRDMVNVIDPLIILDSGRIIFQQDLASVASKLIFKTHTGLTEPANAWYAERIPGGYLTVADNTTGEETDVDLEVLFNAIIQHPDKMKKLFPL